MKTNSKEFNAKIYPYILNAIDGENYGVKAETDGEKLTFLANTFEREYLSHYSISYYGSVQNCLKNWIQGLPSSFNIDFENYEILKIAKEWGSIPENATEKQEDKILDNWFNLVAFKTLQLFKKHGIVLVPSN